MPAISSLSPPNLSCTGRSSFRAETIEVAGIAIEQAGGLNLTSTPHCVKDLLRSAEEEVIPAGTIPSSFTLRRRGVRPRTHVLLVLRPCAGENTGER